MKSSLSPDDDLQVRLQTRIELSNVGLKMIGGVKGLPEWADFYIDARGLPDGVGRKPGSENWTSNVDWVKSQIDVGSYLQIALDAIHRVKTRRKEKKDPYAEPFRIVIYCAYGMHRSPALRDILAQELTNLGYNATVANTKTVFAGVS